MPHASFLADSMLSRLVFEEPGTLVISLVIAWAVMRLIGRRGEYKKLLLASWAVLGLAVAIIAVSELVVTPREKLQAALDQMILAIEQGDLESFHAVVPEDATAKYLGVEFDRARVDARLSDLQVEDLMLLSEEVELIDDQNGFTFIRVRARGASGGIEALDVSDWAIDWRLRDGQWEAFRFEHQGSDLRGFSANPDRPGNVE